MTPEEISLWLCRICQHNMRDRWYTHPINLAVNDESYTMASDGKKMVLLPGNRSGFISGDSNAANKVAPFLRPVDWIDSIPLPWLKEWAGPAVYMVECPSCKGTAKESPYVHCGFCDGDGTVFPGQRLGCLNGRYFDLNYLAQGLEGVEAETVLFAFYGSPIARGGLPLDPATPLILEPLRQRLPWRVIISPVTLDAKRLEEERPSVFGQDRLSLWLTPRISSIARGLSESGRWNELGVLGDALEDAGCTDALLLRHLREPHTGKCWCLDAIP